MATLIFVHGTSVRRAGFDQSLKAIRSGLSVALAEAGQSLAAVEGCLWGDSCGVRLNAGGQSVPEYEGHGEARVLASPVADNALLWEMLEYDPLFELHGLALRERRLVPAFDLGSFKIEVRNLPEKVSDALLEDAGVSIEAFREACGYVAGSKVLNDALLTAANASECLMATVRAVAADALARVPDWPRPPAVTDLSARKRFLDGIVAGFRTKVPMAPLIWASNALHGLAERLGGYGMKSYLWLGVVGGTPLIRSRKGQVTDQAALFCGDILLYQARGYQIRDAIKRQVELAVKASGPPVVLLGHSLGGIACVDLLVLEAFPSVPLLVTVGSQAPFLYELNALSSLEFGTPLPGHFVKRWVNIYDPSDFLSYKAEGVFNLTNSSTELLDEKVNNGMNFPHSHGGYWANAATWQILAREIARL
jgi:hypothetical protein